MAPEVNQLPRTGTLVSAVPNPTCAKMIQEKRSATNKRLVVTPSLGRAPMKRPKRPAMRKPRSGRKTMATITRSALHRIDVFNRDRAAIAVISDEHGKADRRLCRRDSEDEQREHLAG